MNKVALVLCVTLFGSRAAPSRAAPQPTTDAPAEGSAAIVLVTKAPEAEELRALLAELLARERVSVDFSRASRFDTNQLFASAEDDDGVRVFVRIEDDGMARLYFRGPHGERFLLRSVALTHGLDAVDRELVAQAVASSVSALLSSNEGLSREQASSQVARETAANESRAQARAPSPAASIEKRPEETSSRKARPSEHPAAGFFLAARYQLLWFGSELALAHGPGFELGFGGERSSFRYRLRFAAERWFSQKLMTHEFSSSVQTSALRCSVDLAMPLALRHFAVAALGAGLDVTFIDPGSAEVAGLTPTEPRRHVTPLLRPELRYEFSERAWFFGLSGLADIALIKTHYDVRTNGTSQRLATPWQVRPGASAALGLRW